MPLTERLFFLGEIPRTNSFENKSPIGERLINGIWEPDYVLDDSALVYCGEKGLTIITGCSHSGICNITEYAKAVCGDDRIAGIIGGFHLLDITPQVEKSADYLRLQHPSLLCPCHCTCFHARAAIHNTIPIKELCVGDVLEIMKCSLNPKSETVKKTVLHRPPVRELFLPQNQKLFHSN